MTEEQTTPTTPAPFSLLEWISGFLVAMFVGAIGNVVAVVMSSSFHYKVVGGVRFYERREVKDALAYLRTIANPSDLVSLRRILNVPKRGIGDRAEACIEAFATRERITFWEALQRAGEAPGIATRSLTMINSFVELIEQLASMVTAGERVRQVRPTASTGRTWNGCADC